MSKSKNPLRSIFGRKPNQQAKKQLAKKEPVTTSSESKVVNPSSKPIPELLTKADLLKPIPTFQETAGPHKQNLFIHKLKLCQIMFDWNESNLSDNRAKDVKRQQLLELVEYIGKNKNIYTDPVLTEIVQMVAENLFRTLPPKIHKTDVAEGEEDPVLEVSWPHLQIVYEFFLRFIVSSDVEIKVLKKYITKPFILKLLDLFDSEDARERDYLKTILHRIYAKFMSVRSFIRKSINNVFFIFIWETERHNGIAELLEILGSIINGFALPLKEEHKSFLQRVLIPMHKVASLAVFYQQLSYCVTQFVDKDPMLAVPVISGLLRFWPILNSNKELLFLNELEELLELTQPEEFKIVLVPLFKKLGRSIGGPHFQVSERVLFYWHNEYISGLIADYRAEILPLIYPVLHVNSQHHWNPTVNNLTLNVLKIFMEIDQPLVESCSKAYTESLEQKAESSKERKKLWAELTKAKDNKTEEKKDEGD